MVVLVGGGGGGFVVVVKWPWLGGTAHGLDIGTTKFGIKQEFRG